MEKQNALLQTVAEFMGINPDQVSPDLPFTGPRFQGSLARTQLYVALQQRLGLKCPAVFTARTYGELQNAVSGTTLGSPPLAPLKDHQKGTVSSFSSPDLMESSALIACGIDLERVDHLPEVQDYWEDPFYSLTFAPTEIAYCLMQEHPRMHFAARWCVKEALKKCDPAYLHEDMRNLEVVLDERGAPFLAYHAQGAIHPLPCSVSMSHTPDMAIGMVVKWRAPQRGDRVSSPAGPPSTQVAVDSDSESIPAQSSRSSLIQIIAFGITLGLALWAFVRTL